MTMKQISLAVAALAVAVLTAYNFVPHSSAKDDGTPAPLKGEEQDLQRDKCIENCG